MKGFIKWLENAPLIIKIIFALPCLDIVWAIYRLFRSILKKNILGIILAIILIPVGAVVIWVFDLVCIFVYGKVLWFDQSFSKLEF